VGKAREKLKARNLLDAVMIDCSHDNSGQTFKGQAFVFKSVLDQRIQGNTGIIGLMLESNLFEGSQKCNGHPECLAYGVSVTDECISWDSTEELVLYAAGKL
jgi:3-deoxy-7-phosphoheptulonate synthase